MTTRELNRDIARLARDSKYTDKNLDRLAEHEQNMKKEIDRLYHADEKFEYMSKRSVLILIRLNLRYRAIAFHHFGGKIEL